MNKTVFSIAFFLVGLFSFACQPTKKTKVPSTQPIEQASSTSSPTTEALLFQDTWVWENPNPVGNLVLSIWGKSLDDFYAVGDSGVILQFDGKKLVSIPSKTKVSLTGVWGTQDGDLFIVGDKGTILQSYQGSDLALQAVGGTRKLNDVWGSSGKDVFVIGDEGTILHYDGETWKKQKTNTKANLYSIIGRGPKDVYVVGDEGSILRYDGEAWSLAQSNTKQMLLDVQVFGRNVFAVGKSGEVLVSSDGFSFTKETLPSPDVFHLLFRDPGGQILAMGFRQMALYNGSNWDLQTLKTEPLLSVMSHESGAIFATMSGRVFRWFGEEIRELSQGVRAQYNDVFVNQEGKAFIAAENGIYEKKEGEWVQARGTEGAYFEGVDGKDTLFAVGPAGLIMQKSQSDSGWIREVSPTQEWITDVYVASENRVFAVGHKGTFLLRDDTGKWQNVPTPTSYAFSGIAGNNNEVYAVGESGTIYRYDGKEFFSETAPVLEDFKAISVMEDMVFIVGKNGTILRRENEEWIEESVPSQVNLFAIFSLGKENILAVGDKGTILSRSKEGVWSKMDSGTVLPLLGISGNSSRMVVVGGGGAVLARSFSQP